MMTAHSPFPWKRDGSDRLIDANGEAVTFSRIMNSVGNDDRQRATALANGQFIDAISDLIEAGNEMADHLMRRYEDGDVLAGEIEYEWRKAFEKATTP